MSEVIQQFKSAITFRRFYAPISLPLCFCTTTVTRPVLAYCFTRVRGGFVGKIKARSSRTRHKTLQLQFEVQSCAYFFSLRSTFRLKLFCPCIQKFNIKILAQRVWKVWVVWSDSRWGQWSVVRCWASTGGVLCWRHWQIVRTCLHLCCVEPHTIVRCHIGKLYATMSIQSSTQVRMDNMSSTLQLQR